jgi:hypothetical protein
MPFQSLNQGLGQGAEGGGADIGHIRVPQGHDSVQLTLRFL